MHDAPVQTFRFFAVWDFAGPKYWEAPTLYTMPCGKVIQCHETTHGVIGVYMMLGSALGDMARAKAAEYGARVIEFECDRFPGQAAAVDAIVAHLDAAA